MSTPQRTHESAQKFGYAPRRPIPRGAALPSVAAEYDEPRYDEETVADKAPRRRFAEIEEDEPMYTRTTQSRPEGCSATLLNIVLIVIVLGFAVWGVRQTGILNAGAPAQTTIDEAQQPTPTIRPRATPTQIPPYDNAAHNATAEVLQAAQEAPQATEAPPADPPTPAPAWHPPMATEYDVCAAWHAPLALPAECGAQDEAGWHAPMTVKP